MPNYTINPITNLSSQELENLRRWWTEECRRHGLDESSIEVQIEQTEMPTTPMPEKTVRFNNIFLQKKLSIMIPVEGTSVNKLSAASIEKNIRSLGYSLTPALFKKISTLGCTHVQNLLKDIVPVLKGMKNKAYNQIYDMTSSHTRMPDNEFPKFFKNQVELWATRGHDVGLIVANFAPDLKWEKRELTEEESNLEFITLGTLSNFEKIFTNILEQEEPTSAFDRNVLREFIMNYGIQIGKLLPDEIPLKENIGLLGGLLLEHAKDATPLSKYVESTSDIYNIINSLQESTKKPFTRATKRWFLSELEKSKNLVDDVLSKQSEWKALIPNLRPEDYKKRFPRTFMVFDAIQNNKPVDKINSNYELAILNKDVVKAAEILKDKPEIFAAKLDSLIRLNPKHSTEVFNNFLRVAQFLPVSTIFKLWHHFNFRGQDPGDIPLQNYAPLLPLPSDISKEFTLRLGNIIQQKLMAKPYLGNAYVNSRLKDIFVPFSRPELPHPLSMPLKTLVRGSKISIPEQYDPVRVFLWWKDAGERTDLDLGAFLVGERFEFGHCLSAGNLASFGAKSSGDISAAPNGAAEYIDISPYRVARVSCRYIVFYIASQTKQLLNTIPECYVGWGNTDEPPNITNSKAMSEYFPCGANILSSSRYCIPLVIDVVNRQAVWTDLPLSSPIVFHGKKSNYKQLALMLYNVVLQQFKPNLFELFKMHVTARGSFVNEADAQKIFKESDAYKVDEILNEYLQ